MLVLRGAAGVLQRQGIRALQLEYGTHWFRTGQAHDNDRATLGQLVTFLDAFGYDVYYVTQSSLLRLNAWHAAFELPVGSATTPLLDPREPSVPQRNDRPRFAAARDIIAARARPFACCGASWKAGGGGW
eukprot:946155-Prymnesium_polylepis.1